MKKTITLIALALISVCSFAQTDSTKKERIGFNASFAVMSRNYSRGINYGDGISLQPTGEVFYKNATIGVAGCLSNNTTHNYGNTFDSYISYKIKNFTIGFHDFYYINKVDSVNDFLMETGKGYLKDSLPTNYRDGHYFEAQLKYTCSKFYIMAAYNFYNTTVTTFQNSVYFEAEYKLKDGFSAMLGYTTGGNNLIFYTDQYNKGTGFTCIGLNWLRTINITNSFATDLKIQLHVNPNYKNISPGLTKTPFNMVVSLAF